MVNFILFSVVLSVLIFLQLACITFISRENINVIVFKEKEIIPTAKYLATGQACLQGPEEGGPRKGLLGAHRCYLLRLSRHRDRLASHSPVS